MNIPSIKITIKKKFKNHLLFDLKDLNLYFGKIYFLTLANGKGKTTFLKCLVKDTAFQGEVLDEHFIYAYLPEIFNLPYFTKAKTFLTFFDLDVERLDRLEDALLLKEHLDKPIFALSKGTKQKIMLVKTLCEKADIYLFDEPLNGLDEESRKVFIEELQELSKRGALIIISSHYFEEYKMENKERIIWS